MSDCIVPSLLEGGLWCGLFLRSYSSERNSECFSIKRPSQRPDSTGQPHTSPTLVSYLANALLEQWSKVPINTLLNLEELKLLLLQRVGQCPIKPHGLRKECYLSYMHVKAD